MKTRICLRIFSFTPAAIVGASFLLLAGNVGAAGEDTDVTLSAGALAITDANGGSTADTLTLSLQASNIRITDPTHTLGAGPGTTQVDPNTVDVPLASITAGITVNTLGGNDTLTLALAGGNFLGTNLAYNGGTQTSTPGDKIIITGGSQGTVTYNYTNANDGNIVMSNFGTVSYTGLEPITNSGTASDIIFNLPAAASTATLADDGTASNTLSRLSGATFELTDFANPTGSVTINRGNAADTLAVNALPDLTSSLTIGAAGTVFTTVTFNGAITLAADKNLAVFASGTISLPNTASDLACSGTGTIALTTARNIALASGASLTTVNGALTLNANQQVSPTTGTFEGISLINATVLATGTGVVTVNGRGGTVAAGNRGVFLNTSSVIRGGTTSGVMTTDVFGTGGSGGSNPHGVDIENSSTVTSLGGDVRVRGFAGTSSSANNYGVIPVSGGVITSGGNGNVTVQGTGGSNAGGGNVGVIPHQGGGTITSGGTGTVTVTGTGGNGGNSHGVQLFRDGFITSGGAGAVAVSGTSSNSSSFGVFVNSLDNGANGARINSGVGGTITVTASAPSGVGGIVGSGPKNLITSGGNAAITLIADVMTLETSNVSSGTGPTTFRPLTNGKTISLGNADAGSQLGLTDTELDRVTAGTLNIGDANTGLVTVFAAITRTGATSVFNVTSGVNIDIATGSLSNTGGNLMLLPGTNVFPSNSGVDVTTSASSTLGITSGKPLKIVINNATVDTGYTQLNVAGRVNISGVNLALSGTAAPVGGEAYTIVNNDAADAITGTFVGLPEGSLMPNFFGSGLHARISYVDGDGNDAVIRVYTNRETWRIEHFGSAANTGIGADANDAEGDGLSNILEFATGSDPNVSNPPPGVLLINGATMELSYSRSLKAIGDGFIFNVEFQDNLTPGGWSTAGVSQQLLPGGSGGVQFWRASVSMGSNGRRFLRMNVSPPTP